MTFTPVFPLIPYAAAVALAIGGALIFYFRTRKSSSASSWSWARRAGAFFLALFLGFGPAVLEDSSESVRVNTDVYVVVDRTGSMAAEDYNGKKPRLNGVKKDIEQLAGELAGGRFSVISFDSAASRQLPLTTDTAALIEWAKSLTQEITIYSSGSNTNRAFSELGTLLQRGRERNPQNQQVVFIMTDGENTSDGPRSNFSQLAQFIDGGAVLGYGTPEGGRMKRYDPLLDEDEYILDYSSATPVEAISKIDEKDLKALASELGIPYLHRSEPGPLSEVTASLEKEMVSAQGTRTLKVPQLLLWPFASAIALLLIWEACGSSRRMTLEVG